MRTKEPKQVRVPQGFDPHAEQVEVLASDARMKLVMAGRRWGKTRMAAAQTLMWIHQASMDAPKDPHGKDMTKTLRPPIHCWVVGPNYLQLKQVMEEFAGLIPPWQLVDRYQTVARGTRQYETRMKLKYRNGQKPPGCVRQEVLIEFKSADNWQALQTVGLDVLYLTESQDIVDAAMEKVLPTLISPYRLKRALFEGIPPDSANHWFARYWELANRGLLEGAEAFKYASTGNYHLGIEGVKEIEGDRHRMTDEAWKRMYFAVQPKGSGAYFRNIFEAATLDENDYQGPVIGERYVAGLDIGRRNSESVLVVKNSRTRDSVYAESFGDSDWDLQLMRFEQICRDWRVDVLHFDGTSCGGDLMHYLLEQSDLPAIPFEFTQKSKHQLYEKYAFALEKGLVRFPKQWSMLIKQLQAVRNKSTKVAKFESDGGVLDDWVDAEALALFVCEEDVVEMQEPIYHGGPDVEQLIPAGFINGDDRAAGEYHRQLRHNAIFDKLRAPSYNMIRHAQELEGAWD